jgi:hypothetical protein
MKLLPPAILAAILFCAACNLQPQKPLTDSDYQIFAERLDSALHAKDIAFVTSNIDEKTFSDTMRANLDIGVIDEIQYSKQVMAGLRKALTTSLGTATFHRLRYEKKNGSWRSVYRVQVNGAGLNYHEFILAERNGKIVLRDIFVYLTGEYLSQSLAFLTKTQNSMMSDGNFLGGAKPSAELQNDITQLQAMQANLSQNRPEEAMDAYNLLSEGTQHSKGVRSFYLIACSQVSEQVYADAIMETPAFYPGDSTLALMLIDGFFIAHRYEEAQVLVNMLDKKVNDPYLDFYRGNIFLRMDSVERAAGLIRKAIDNTTGLNKATMYQNLLVCHLTLENEAAAGVVCDEMLSRKVATTNELLAICGSSWFVNTATYRRLFPY